MYDCSENETWLERSHVVQTSLVDRHSEISIFGTTERNQGNDGKLLGKPKMGSVITAQDYRRRGTSRGNYPVNGVNGR